MNSLSVRACAVMLCLAAMNARAEWVILNPQVAESEISVNGLRAIFSMRRRIWSDGYPITVFVLPDTDPVHQIFAKKLLGIYPHQLRRAWDKGVFTGTGQAPIEVANEEEMRDRVAITRGGIGYLSTKEQAEEVVRVLDAK